VGEDVSYRKYPPDVEWGKLALACVIVVVAILGIWLLL
jgi:hypothetical protein